MSVLGLTGSIRPSIIRATVATETHPLEPRIDWVCAQDGLWSGRLGLEHAGVVERTDAGFVATDWQGETEGVFVSLDEAQHALEPEVRAARRDAQERRRARRTELLLGSTLGIVCTSALAAAAWLLTLPL